MEPLISGDRTQHGMRASMPDGDTSFCILNALPVPLIVVSGSGDLRYLNPLAASLFGVDPRDAVGERIEDVFSTGTTFTLKKLVTRTSDFSVTSDGTIRHAYRDYAVHTAPLKCGDGTPATVIVLHPMPRDERIPDLAPKACPNGSGHWVPIFVPADH